MHHIFVNEKNINGDNINLNKLDDIDTFNHLKVLRLNIDEKIIVSSLPYKEDKNYIAKVISFNNESIELKIIDIDKKREIVRNIFIYMGLIKKDAFELAIEKTVELGVKKIIPVLMDYSKSNFFSNSNNKYKKDIQNKNSVLSDKDLIRLNTISKTAATQCNRPYIPEVINVISFEDMISDIKSENEDYINIMLYENKDGLDDTISLLNEIKKTKKQINIIVGPEGGFSNIELELLNNKNIKIISLGDRVLRAETAAIAIMSLVSIYA